MGELGKHYAVNAREGNISSLPGSTGETEARSRYVAPLARTSSNFLNYKPAEEVHADPLAKFMESRSCFHRAFCAYDQDQMRLGRAEPAAPAKNQAVLPAFKVDSVSRTSRIMLQIWAGSKALPGGRGANPTRPCRQTKCLFHKCEVFFV